MTAIALNSPKDTKAAAAHTRQTSPATRSAQPPPPADTPTPRPKRVPRPENVRVTGIGDSIMLMSAAALERRLPKIIVDAKVSRQMMTLDDRIDVLAARHEIGDVVVVGLGTNGPFDPSYLDRQLDRLGGQRRVILVDVTMPDAWEDRVNHTLEAVARRHPNVTIAEWKGRVRRDPGLLGGDGTHPVPRGSEVYADMIYKAVRAALKR
jgi:lysophospholipase L1-like esterase